MSKYFIIEPPIATATTVYDYTSSYSAILSELNDIDIDTTALAASVVLIATSLATIATNSTTVATNSTTVAEKMTAIETYQKKIKELGEGPGIHMVGPYDWLSFISAYIYYVNKGEILKTDENASPADVTRALDELRTYFEKVNTLPTNF